MDLTQIAGSLGGVTAAGLGVAELVKRWRGRRTDSRIAIASAEGLELDNAAKLKKLWDEQFEAMQAQIDAVQADMGKARRSWERERVSLQRQVREERENRETQVSELTAVVEALRDQIRGAGLTPAA